MIVVDRVDLDTQITATFNTAEVPNMITTDSIKNCTSYWNKTHGKSSLRWCINSKMLIPI
jgi:type I site-specific restriction-modification system R (restriction) subunit